jgi:hypothetical protein
MQDEPGEMKIQSGCLTNPRKVQQRAETQTIQAKNTLEVFSH